MQAHAPQESSTGLEIRLAFAVRPLIVEQDSVALGRYGCSNVRSGMTILLLSGFHLIEVS